MHSGKTEIDEYVRKLLSKLDHIRKLTKLNVKDFMANYKRKYDEKFQKKAQKIANPFHIYFRWTFAYSEGQTWLCIAALITNFERLTKSTKFCFKYLNINK